MSNPAPRVGKTFNGHIHRIDEDGNGIIETYGGQINIGPVLPDSEGEWIEALKLPGEYARCNSRKVTPDDYLEQINEQFPHDLPLGPDEGHVGGILGKRSQGIDEQKEKYRPIDYNEWIEYYSDPLCEGDRYQVEIIQTTGNGNGIVEIEGREINIGPIKKDAIGSAIDVKITGPKSVEVLDDSVRPTHTVEVDRINNSGDGIIEIEGREINIGPVSKQAVGSDVDIRIRGEQGVEVFDDSVRPPYTYTVEVDRINDSGDGIVEVEGREINIGPVREDIVGSKISIETDVEVEITEPKSVEVLDESVRPTHTVEVDRISNSGNGIVYVKGQEINIGPIDEEIVGSEITVRITGSVWGSPVSNPTDKNDDDNVTNSSKNRASDSLTPEENSMIESNSEIGSFDTSDELPEDQPAANVDNNTSVSTETADETRKTAEESNAAESPPIDTLDEIEGDEATRDAPLPAVGSASSTSTSNSTSQLKSLRAEAEAAASDDPVRDTSSSSSGSRYRRAPEIKEYARTRADGVCEVCSEPAPFETDDGQPYLEVHHVEELGQGGEDHPDKVAALCPTCHKRIHHGVDGSALNERLREKLEEGLADVGTGTDNNTE